MLSLYVNAANSLRDPDGTPFNVETRDLNEVLPLWVLEVDAEQSHVPLDEF
jgi:hypothetical protein